jgi:L-alanine-DL-glutamate epimerase-like enolase superfamily enzyme
MKIKAVHVMPSLLPKKDKDWKFALRADPMFRGWVVAIEAQDGLIGYGYGAAQPQYGSPYGVVKAALDIFKPLLIGQNPRRIAAIMEQLDRVTVGNNQAKSAVDCALHDLEARQLGMPIADLFGGSFHSEFRSMRILPIKSPRDMAANARRLFDQGFRNFKIKIHGNVEEDVSCVAAIREEVGAGARLTVDANQSYTPKDAIKAIRRMEPYGIDLAEQPVPCEDLYGLKAVADAVDVMVEADESIWSVEQVARVVRERMADIVNLQITKLGGLRKTLTAARLCEYGGVKYRFGAHTGPALLAAHAVQLASSLPSVGYACEFTEFLGIEDDPWQGLDVTDGVLAIPRAEGCGVLPRANSGIILA